MTHKENFNSQKQVVGLIPKTNLRSNAQIFKCFKSTNQILNLM